VVPGVALAAQALCRVLTGQLECRVWHSRNQLSEQSCATNLIARLNRDANCLRTLGDGTPLLPDRVGLERLSVLYSGVTNLVPRGLGANPDVVRNPEHFPALHY